MSIVRSSARGMLEGSFTSFEAVVEERDSWNTGWYSIFISPYRQWPSIQRPMEKGKKSIKNLSPKLFCSLLTISISWIFISPKFHFYELFYLTHRGTSFFASFFGKIAFEKLKLKLMIQFIEFFYAFSIDFYVFW